MKRKKKNSRAGRDKRTAQEAARKDWSELPGWAPHVIFALLALFLFREFVVSNGLLFGTDVAALGYFARHFYAETIRVAHVFPHWDPYVYGGLPFVDAMHGDIFYPTTVLKFIMAVHRAMGWKLVLHIFLAGVFTYGWLRHLKLSRQVATFGGVAYMLAPVMVTLVYPGHDGKLFVSALTPLALWATDWSVTRGGTWRFAVLSLVVSLLIFTAHMQLAYYVVWAVMVLAVFRLVQRRRSGGTNLELARRFGAFALAGLIGAVGIGAVQLWTPLRYLTKHSQRVAKSIEAETEDAYTRATSWSLHPEEAFSLAVPEFVGGNVQTEQGPENTYWGRNPFKLNHEYGGLIPLLLLPLAFLNRRRRSEAWLFTGIAAASLIYALGATTPLFRFFYWLVPGVKLFRAPSSIMFVFAIAVISAAALGLEAGRQSGDEEDDEGAASAKATLYLWIATGVFLLLALLGSGGGFTDLWVSTLYRDIAPAKAAALQENLSNIQRGLWLTFLLCGPLAAGWYLYRRGSVSRAAWVTLVAILAVLDPMRVNPRFIQVVEANRIYARDETTDFLIGQRQQNEPFRVFSVTQGGTYQPNQFAFYGVEELTGHHGNELGRYMDLIDFQRHGSQWVRVLTLLNVRYLVSDRLVQLPRMTEVFRGSRSLVYELDGAYPRARLVSQFETAPDSLALQRLLSPEFDPAGSVILERQPEPAPQAGAGGEVRWQERGINSQTLEVDADGAVLLVISDNYYPAWTAEIDGRPAPVLRANYSTRAVAVPAGTHVVRFKYESPLFRAAVWSTLLSLVLVVGLICWSVLGGRRRGVTGAGASE